MNKLIPDTSKQADFTAALYIYLDMNNESLLEAEEWAIAEGSEMLKEIWANGESPVTVKTLLEEGYLKIESDFPLVWEGEAPENMGIAIPSWYAEQVAMYIHDRPMRVEEMQDSQKAVLAEVSKELYRLLEDAVEGWAEFQVRELTPLYCVVSE